MLNKLHHLQSIKKSSYPAMKLAPAIQDNQAIQTGTKPTKAMLAQANNPSMLTIFNYRSQLLSYLGNGNQLP